MSFLSSPGNLFPGFSSSSPRRLRPGDDGYCQRCAFEGHDRTNCPDSNHRNIVSGGPCPHPRRRGVAPEGAPTLGPGDSASQTGGDDYSLAGLLRRISRPTQANPGQQVTAADVIAQPGYGHLSQTEAQRLADLYNNALRQAAREDTERRLRELGINPNTVLDPVTPPQAPSAPAFTAGPQVPVAAPVAPGTTQVIPFPGPTPPGQPRLVHNVEIGHITPNIAATNLAVLHRATYDANAIQTQLTAAAAGTFRTLAYLAFRFNLTNVTHGWRLQIRVVQQATLPAAPTTVNAFTAIGGTLIDRDSTTANAHAGVSTITFPTPIDLSMPIHVVAIFAIASGTNATTSMGRIALECGANADP